MTCKICGSHAINHHLHGRDGTKDYLCDVCFWIDNAHELKRQLDAANKLLAVDSACVVENATLRRELDAANAERSGLAAALQLSQTKVDELKAKLDQAEKERNEFFAIYNQRNEHEHNPNPECSCPCCNLHRLLANANAKLKEAEADNAKLTAAVRAAYRLEFQRFTYTTAEEQIRDMDTLSKAHAELKD